MHIKASGTRSYVNRDLTTQHRHTTVFKPNTRKTSGVQKNLEQKSMKTAILDFGWKHQSIKVAQALMDFKLLDPIDEKITMVLLPTDEAFESFFKTNKLDYVTIRNTPQFAAVIKNHYSVVPTKRVYPMFTAVTGLTYGNSEADLKSLGAKEVLILQRSDALKVPVISISTVLFTTGQRERLQKLAQPNTLKK